MARIAIVTDSTADLDRATLEALDVVMIPLGLRIGHDHFLDRVDVTTQEFLDRLSMSAPHPATFSPAPSAFEAAFRRLAKDHDAVVALLLSSKLGGSVRAARVAAAAAADAIRVDVIDSMNASLGLGFQVRRAAELARSGLGLEEISARIKAERALHHLAFFCDSLDYLQHGGRIGLAASLVGGLLQLKPLLQIEEGQVVPLDRTRTRAKAIAGLEQFAEGFTRIDRLGILYSTEPAAAESLRASLSGLAPPDRLVVRQFGPVIAAHVGPGALGVCVYEGPEPL